MYQKTSFFLIVIFLSGCAFMRMVAGVDENIVFEGKPVNYYFDYRRMLLHQNVALLPIRSSMIVGGGDDRLNAILIQTIKKNLSGMYLITDEMADQYFTENDMWDDYFSYVSLHAAKGLEEIDELVDLYSMIQVSAVFSITSDFRFSGVEGMYPRNFEVFVSTQIFDINKRRIIWDGMVEAHEVVEFKEEEDEVVRSIFRKVTEKLISEIKR